MRDLKSRMVGRIHLTTDKLISYPAAVEAAFGRNIDYAQVSKKDGGSSSSRMTVIFGNPDPKLVHNSFIERQNRTMRMLMRRFARKTEAHSRTAGNHLQQTSLYFTYYNFCRAHSSLGTFITPAMAAGVDDEQHDLQWILDITKTNQKRKEMVALFEAIVRRGKEKKQRMRTGRGYCIALLDPHTTILVEPDASYLPNNPWFRMTFADIVVPATGTTYQLLLQRRRRFAVQMYIYSPIGVRKAVHVSPPLLMGWAQALGWFSTLGPS